MIASLDGLVTEIDLNSITLEVNGVGYQVFIPNKVLTTLTIGNPLKLFTAEIIREDSHTLFGFPDKDTKLLFVTLQSVSGVGPKLALEITNTFSLDQLKIIIINSDIKSLTQISGVGKKVAERLHIELKDKLDKLFVQNKTAAAPDKYPVLNSNLQLTEALASLGFDKKLSQPIVENVLIKHPDIPIETALKLALKELDKK